MGCEVMQYDGRPCFISHAGRFLHMIPGNGKAVYFEYHRYFGPIRINIVGEPVRHFGPTHPFWDAFELWRSQGERLTHCGQMGAIEATCVWDPAEGDRP